MRWKIEPDVSICGCTGAENPEETDMAIEPHTSPCADTPLVGTSESTFWAGFHHAL